MKATLIPTVLAAALLSACSGGGGTSAPVPATPTTTLPASGTIQILGTVRTPGSGARKPAYISAGTTAAHLFVDTSTTVAGSTTSCTAAGQPGCTISYTTSAGSHTFAVEIDNGTVVLGEGKTTTTVAPGTGNNFTITVNGASARAGWVSDTSSTTATITGKFSVSDASSNFITGSAFDNGSVTLAPSGVTGTGTPSVTAGSPLATPDANGNDYTFTVSCGTLVSGTFTLSATAGTPTGSGDVSASQLTAIGSVNYPSSINTSSMITYACDASGTISDASGGGTIQAHGRGTL